MRSHTLLAVLCMALLATSAFAHGDHGDHSHDEASDDVVVLNSESFDASVGAADLSLVEFFAPWCGHCKSLAPNFARAATALKGVAQLASVDCTVEKDLCSRYGVQGFPTLKVFRASGDINKPADYQGGRTDKDIIKYIRKQTEPSYVEVNTEAELEAFRAREGVEIVGVFASLESDEAKAFIAAAVELRNDYTFAVSTNAELATASSASVPAVLLFKEGSEPAVATAADVESTAALKKFIQSEAFDLVGEIGPENFQKYLDRGLPLVWCFLDFTASDSAKALLEQIATAAATVKGQLSVVKLDGVRWIEHAKHFGLTGALPGIVVEDRTNNKNYIFHGEVTSAALTEHLKGFLAGSLKANLKTQPEPENNNGPVTVLVGSNFERIVMDETKDVLVEFYAPWCGHCKSLAPKWDALGEEFAKDENVVIAKVDATENDTPAKIEGFPTLIFYPAGTKTPVTFEGDRSVEAMAKFIRDNRKSAAPAGVAATEETTDEPNHEEL